MRKKTIVLFVIIMLSLPIITVLGANNKKINESEIQNQIFEDEIILNIKPTANNIGVNLEIENTGETTLNNLKWSFRSKAAISGTGFFIREKLQEGILDEIDPGEILNIKFRPFISQTKSPIGLGNIYMNASLEYDNVYVRTQKRAFILTLFLLNYKKTYMDIKPAEAYQRLQNNEFDLVIDVVGLDIYSLGHLPGAVNYVWADGTLRSKIPELDPSLTYLVYCHTDPPSTSSAQILVDAGFENIYRLEGNYAAWKNAGYPIET